MVLPSTAIGAQPQSKTLLTESIDLISNTTVLGVLHGIACTLYCLCARSLYLQTREPDKRGQARFTLTYISLLLFCSMVYFILTVRMNQLAYINHADFPGGPFAYEKTYNSTTESYEIAIGILDMIVESLTMAIQVWRLWVIWSGTRYRVVVTSLPVLLLLSYLALDIPVNIAAALSPIDQLGLSSQCVVALDTARYAIQGGLTVTVTGLVATRLLLVRRRSVKLMGISDSPYLSIVTMLIESYALESAWSTATAISSGLKNPSHILFVANDSTVKVIAYFLVVYRVAAGRGWNAETGRKLTTLSWKCDEPTVTNGP